MATRDKVLIAEPLDFSEAALNVLTERCEVEMRECDRNDLSDAMRSYDALWFRLGHRIDASLFPQELRCRVLASPVTGLDHIDLEACSANGVRMVSLRGEVEFLRTVRATAELTIAILLALLRHIPRAVEHTRAGNWQRDLFRGHELYGRTVGVVGVGRLGSIVAEMLNSFGMDVHGYDPRGIPPGIEMTKHSSLYDLLAVSDVVSLHVSYSPKTRNMIGERELAAMKPGAILVNTSRGGLIEEPALVAALERGQLSGAALDVLDGEPKIGGNPLVRRSRHHDDVLIVPHIGGNTSESFEKTEVFLAGRVLEALEVSKP